MQLQDLNTICWMNGEWHDANKPLITPIDRGFLYGDGVFETVRSLRKRFFRLDRHLMRLQRGLDVLNIDPGDALDDALSDLALAFESLETEDIIIRLTVTRGSGWLHSLKMSAGFVTILARQAPAATSEAGRAILSSVVCDATSPIADIKTCNWLPNILARQEAEGLGYDEAILCNSLGYITEASASNIFWVQDGELFTPAVESGALPGITREAVIESALSQKIAVYQGSFLPRVLRDAEAAFLTNSVSGIKQLISFGDAPLLQDDPNRVVSRVRDELASLIDSEIGATGVG